MRDGRDRGRGCQAKRRRRLRTKCRRNSRSAIVRTLQITIRIGAVTMLNGRPEEISTIGAMVKSLTRYAAPCWKTSPPAGEVNAPLKTNGDADRKAN